MTDAVRYPVGLHVWDAAEFPRRKEEWLAQIAECPARLRAAVQGLSESQLDTPYREGGWTPRQVVHHVADSHMNVFIRIKLALTEAKPLVKVYDENLWARLEDSLMAPVELSLALIANLHARWVLLLRSLSSEQWLREFNHPENGPTSIAKALSHYAWHGRQHTAHISGLRTRRGW